MFIYNMGGRPGDVIFKSGRWLKGGVKKHKYQSIVHPNCSKFGNMVPFAWRTTNISESLI